MGWRSKSTPVCLRPLSSNTPRRSKRVGNSSDVDIFGSEDGDEAVALLADGLRRGCLPSLTIISLTYAQIGPQGTTALASALTKRALPSLEKLGLNNNPLGDAGMAALSPALRRLPKIETIWLYQNQIGD